jgi:hypothetical protein
MNPTDTTFEIQRTKLIGTRRVYPVRVTPIPAGKWYLQARSYDYRPCLFYWAMTTVGDTRNPTGNSTWTLWFGFRSPPMDHLDQNNHVGIVSFLAEDEGPHDLMKVGFTFDLFIGPGGIIAKGEILENQNEG